MNSPKFDEVSAATGANSVTQCAFRPRTTPNEDNSTPAKNDKAQSLPFPGTDLNTFPLFPKFPPEVRLMIWKLAAEAIVGRSVSIQPFYDNTPGLLNTCIEAREAGEKRFKHYKSNQESLKFRIFINYDIDILYLNHKFRNGNKRLNSVLTAALQVYPNWMTPERNLAMNVKEMKKMTSAYRNGGLDMWKMLHKSCP